MRLYYEKQAEKWEETLPIGNGSLGAMIWGTVKEEKLGLNQDTIWSGYQRDKNNPNAAKYLQKVRHLVFAGKCVDAEKLIEEHMLGEYNESYLPLGDLNIKFHHNKQVTEYKRILDINHSVARVSYKADGALYTREYFASYPANAIFIKLTCELPNLNIKLSFSSQIECKIVYTMKAIHINGKCPEHVDPNYINNPDPVIQGDKGMEFTADVSVLCTDGTAGEDDTGLIIQNASSIVFMISAVKPAVMDHTMEYEEIKKIHMEDYQKIYNKVDIYFGEQLEIPTDQRLERLRSGGKDNGIYALYFQYGRYLLISSSREGSQPANLQGIWSWDMRSAWSSNWTTNINTQMNYWLAQSCNLQECMEPYFDLLKHLCVEGKKTARIHYHCRGFVHHHNADYWCNTNPVGIAHGEDKGERGCATWSFWPMGGAWLCSELFKHYEYNLDKGFLRETAYPILREAALFLIDWTIEHEGVYVTCPSTSPENRYKTRDGRTSCITISSAMDLALIREVFTNFKRTCEILEMKDKLIEQIDVRLNKLAPFKIGSKGQMLEWGEEFEETELGHRHISHLYGLFPSELFEGNKKLTEACRESLKIRLANGGGHTGWSCAWLINMFAILGDRDQAYKYLNILLVRATHNNLWGDHPPFQIDANFGGTASIANMLVQDRNGTVKILPALPKEFESGYVKGLRIKNCKSVDIEWEYGELKDYHIY